MVGKMINNNLFDCCLTENLNLIEIRGKVACNRAYAIDDLFDNCLIGENICQIK